jgi:hypothetical protein
MKTRAQTPGSETNRTATSLAADDVYALGVALERLHAQAKLLMQVARSRTLSLGGGSPSPPPKELPRKPFDSAGQAVRSDWARLIV